MQQEDNIKSQELTEERIREIVREEGGIVLERIRRQKLDDTEAYYKFASEMGYPPPP